MKISHLTLKLKVYILTIYTHSISIGFQNVTEVHRLSARKVNRRFFVASGSDREGNLIPHHDINTLID